MIGIEKIVLCERKSGEHEKNVRTLYLDAALCGPECGMAWVKFVYAKQQQPDNRTC